MIVAAGMMPPFQRLRRGCFGVAFVRQQRCGSYLYLCQSCQSPKETSFRRVNGDGVSNVRLQVELTSSLLTPAVGAHHFYVFQVWRTRSRPLRDPPPPAPSVHRLPVPSRVFVSTCQCFPQLEHSGLHHLGQSWWRIT